MNARNAFIMVVALVVAVFAAMLARGWLIAQQAAMRPAPTAPVAKVEGPYVLVARASMVPGAFVQAGSLEWAAWPKESVGPAYIVKGKRAMEDFIGAVARTTINAGEPLTDNRVVRAGDRGFLAAVLTRGNRAITVPISATSGNAGFVFPGDLVDVILTAKYSDTPDKNDNGNFYAATLLESVRVLAIDQKTEYNKGDAAVGKTATLEVTPKQAEIIALSLQMGQLQLSLRSLNGQEDNNLASRPAGESTSVANAEATVGEGEKPKRDQERSYVLDKELRFMLDGHAPASREITILRGGEEKKAAY